MSRFNVVIVLAVLFVLQAQAEIHTFTLPDGRTLDAEITAFMSGKVALKRTDGQVVRVKPSVFIAEDQAYIQKWLSLDGVRSTSKFKISCERRMLKSWSKERFGTIRYTDGSRETDQVVGKTDFDDVGYDVELNNRNGFAVDNLMLEYCIYYEQETSSRDKEPHQGVLYGFIDVGKIPAQSKKAFSTKPVTIFKDESNSEFLNARVLKGKVHGIAVRVSAKDGDKAVLLQSSAIPKSILTSYAWKTKSVSIAGPGRK